MAAGAMILFLLVALILAFCFNVFLPGITLEAVTIGLGMLVGLGFGMLQVKIEESLERARKQREEKGIN